LPASNSLCGEELCPFSSRVRFCTQNLVDRCHKRPVSLPRHSTTGRRVGSPIRGSLRSWKRKLAWPRSPHWLRLSNCLPLVLWHSSSPVLPLRSPRRRLRKPLRPKELRLLPPAHLLRVQPLPASRFSRL